MSFVEDVRRLRAGRPMSSGPEQWRERAASAASGVWHWWTAELAGLVPRAVRQRLLGRGTVLTVRLDGDMLRFEPGETVGLDAEALPVGLRRRVGLADAVVLVLPSAMVLRRVVQVPAAAGRALASAVPFLVERHTPFLPDQARMAWRVRDRRDAGIDVELAVTAGAALDRVLARLHALDVAVSSIEVEGDERLPRLDLYAVQRMRRRGRWVAEPWRPLLAAAVILLVAGPVVVAGVVHLRANAMMNALAAHGAKPQERARERADLQAAVNLASALSARAAEPAAAAVLQQVTTALPDSSWLFAFDLTSQTLQLGGFSTDMPATVARLQALPEVEKLEFRSSVIHDVKADRDRFDLLLRWKKAGHA